MIKAKVNPDATKALNIVFAAGYTTEKEILALNLDQILGITKRKMGDVILINDLQKAIKDRSIFSYLCLKPEVKEEPAEVEEEEEFEYGGD